MALNRAGKKKRPSIRSRAERSAKDPRGIYAPPANLTSSLPASNFNESAKTDPTRGTALFDDEFRATKKDKRTIRHNQLLSKVQNSGIRKRPLKRRRPGKKELANGMAGLEEALPDIADNDDNDHDDENDVWGGFDGKEGNVEFEGMRKASRNNRRMVMKSLRHRPGAMKRKDKLEHSERDRFAKNLAGMVGSYTGTEQTIVPTDPQLPSNAAKTHGHAQADRWKALRTFIGGTMEKSKAFAGH